MTKRKAAAAKGFPDKSLIDATRRNFEMISNSNVFFCIFNERMIDEAIPVIQMGLAVYLDKPIVIVAPEGVTIPGNLRAMALRTEFYTPNDEASFKAATQRALLKTVRGM